MNYYQILGLNGQATHSEIKQAYRRLALQYHPDKNPDTKEIFQRINEAYSTLSNENKKYEYDIGN